MKKLYLALLVIAGVALLGLSACRLGCAHGSGNQVNETRKVGDFNKISISGGYKVTLKQDSSLTIKITADDNLLKYIKTVVDGNRLRIYSKKDFCNNGQLSINIGIRNLEELKTSGGIEVESDGKINTQDISFKLTGATKITMDLNANHVTTAGSGVTELNLTGQATSHDIDLSGSGTVNALNFVVGSCDIETSGIGESKVNVLNTLHVNSSGASSVKYKGNPAVTNDKSGASSVEKIN
jgi:hypothetical protein